MHPPYPVGVERAREGAAHWDSSYRDRGAAGVSWFQSDPAVSLELIETLDVSADTAVVDIGGGASLLVDRLLASGFGDLTVLDVSEVALATARARLGAPPQVRWLCEDVLAWRPTRRYGLWHDRAVFHFLTDPAQRDTYVETLWSGIETGGAVIVGTFAADGPEFCSGLPVCRYTPEELADVLGPRLAVSETARELHTTPAGVVQPFTWVAGRGRPDPRRSATR